MFTHFTKEEKAVQEAPVEPVEKLTKVAEPTEKLTELENKPEVEKAPVEQLEIYELKPNEIGGGEFVLPLDGDVKNHVVELPLHAPEVAPAAVFETQEPTETTTQPQETVQPLAVASSEHPAYVVYNQQPEQQHQQRYEQALSPEPTVPPLAPRSEAPTAETAGGFPVPPLAETTQEPMAQSVAESNAWDPAEAYRQHTQASAGTGGERAATKEDVDDAVYNATKAGQARGVVAGGLVVGLYEHLKHRRREKRQEKRIKKQSKDLEKSMKHNSFLVAEQTKRQAAETRRSQTEQRSFAERAREAMQAPVVAAEHMARTAAAANAERRQARVGTAAERTPFANPEQRATLAHTAERPHAQTSEKRFAAAGSQNLEQLTIPSDHHIETSAWHSIEVDTKTGKAVENPTFEYGHEYYQERAQEAAPKDQRNSAAGEVALVAAATSTPPAPQKPGVQPAGANRFSRQGTPRFPLSAKASAKKASKAVQSGLQGNGPLWPWIVALGVVIVLIFAVL